MVLNLSASIISAKPFIQGLGYNNMQEIIVSTDWMGRTLTIKTGLLARQANSAVTVQYGDTVVLATVVEAKQEREGIDFFPLLVDFEERLYAAGIIKGSRWVKREGRPSDEAVLAGRMVDRSIRPLFQDQARKDVQVILTILSADRENDHDIVSLIAASAALSISGVEWSGPIGGIRVGRNKEGSFILNPTYLERDESDLDLIVAGTKERIIMIEAGCQEITEDIMLEAILRGHEELGKAIDLINELKQKAPAKEKINANADGTETQISEDKQNALNVAKDWLNDNVEPILFDKIYYTKGERKAAVQEIKKQLGEYMLDNGYHKDMISFAISKTLETAVEIAVTAGILERKQRVDGRKLDEIRPLSALAGMLPRNHGSGLFSRGETQILSIVTLGSPGMQQQLEGIEGTSSKRYMHHYNFPPYSVGEVKNVMSAGRREIGHGALAEKAIVPVLPEGEEFPYTIRVVSETLSSNGSSSMGSTCGSSLALMDAGVPIKKAVAGIAMGLASNDDMSKWEVLTDIQDLEDGKGGMDFKIAGTSDGITAIQLDTKTIGLSKEIIGITLTRGKTARNQILEVMNAAISEPRPELSLYAPRIFTIQINPDKIRDVIGAGGKVINEIINATGVTIDIEQDGSVVVCGQDSEKCQEALDWINNIVRDYLPGEIFQGTVVRMLDFGAFVEFAPGKDGMAHVSELAPYRIEKPSDFLNIGDAVWVKIKEIDDQGRVNLTLKIPENNELWANEKGKSQRNSLNDGYGNRGGHRRDNNGHRKRF